MEIILRLYRWWIFSIAVMVRHLADDSCLKYFEFRFLFFWIGIERNYFNGGDIISIWLSIVWGDENQILFYGKNFEL
jgi:hypothetical protein